MNKQKSYFEQAMAAQKAGELIEAQRLLESALAMGDERPEIHNNLANLLSRQGQLQEALIHYARAVNLKPDYVEAHFNLGLFFLKQVNVAAAITQFRNVTRLCPEYMSAHFYLANLYFEAEQYDAALREFQIVLQLEPFHIEAHNNVGVLHLKLANSLEAIRSFSNVLRIDETHWEARANLAAILLQQGRYAEASRQYEEILKHRPDDLESRYNLGVALMPQGLLDKAMACFRTILEKQPTYCDAHINLAAILLKQGKKDAAIEHYQTVLQEQPTHPFAGYLLQALTGNELLQAAPAAYVQHLFDNYATYFDAHVQQTLHYETPEQLRRVLIEALPVSAVSWQVLDLGCGTGLSGAVFRDLARELIGIDVSPKMLAVAREKKIYDSFLEGDICEVLQSQSSVCWDLIIAADVFVYTGNLVPIFEQCYRILKESGYFLFSTELFSGNGYQLQKTARYAHSRAYIEQLATQMGFTVIRYQKAPLRQQEDHLLEGGLYLLRR